MSDVADQMDNTDVDPETGTSESTSQPEKDVVQTTESIGSEDSGDADSGVAADDDVEKPYVQLYVKVSQQTANQSFTSPVEHSEMVKIDKQKKYDLTDRTSPQAFL